MFLKNSEPTLTICSHSLIVYMLFLQNNNDLTSKVNMTNLKTIVSLCCIISMLPLQACASVDDDAVTVYPGYKLVFHDEFNVDGKVDSNYWTFDNNHRNHEDQLYTSNNAWVSGGNLVIEARKGNVIDSNGKTWHYTSSCVVSKGKKSGQYVSAWQYGRFEVRAKIPAYLGCWPAIWLLGADSGEWPCNGEIDVMEYYPDRQTGDELLHANAAWGTQRRWVAHWNAKTKKIAELEKNNPRWRDEFHVWRMDWDEAHILLYVDNQLLNSIDLDETVNPRTDFWPHDGDNPFRNHSMYILLNLALGGDNGGSLDNTPFPCQYLIDYVRVYQKTKP